MPMDPRIAAIGDALGITRALLAARGLRACEEADQLVLAERGDDGREHVLVPAAAAAWRKLKIAASRDGIAIFIVSAFRSVERQAEIVRGKLERGATLDEVLAVCAPPGYSEHHTGRAVDLSTPGAPALDIAFDRTSAFAWLVERARDYGFFLSYPRGNLAGYQYEPWHWRNRDGRAGA